MPNQATIYHFLLAAICLFSIPLFGQEKAKAVAKIQPAYQKEIRQLSKKKGIKKAFQLIEKQRAKTLADHILLTEIEAPPFKEEKRAAQFYKMLKDIGVDSIWIDEVGNVLALRKGKIGNKVVALDAHLDTVFPEGTDVKVKMKGDTIYAPGAADDTRGLHMVLRVLQVMNETDIQTESDV